MFTLGWCQRLFDEIHAFTCDVRSAARGCSTIRFLADRLAQLWVELQVGRRSALALVAEEITGYPQRGYCLGRQGRADRARSAAGPVRHRGCGRRRWYAGSLFGAGGPAPRAAAGGRFGYEYLFRFEGPVSVGANELHRVGIAARLGVHPPRPFDDDPYRGPADGLDLSGSPPCRGPDPATTGEVGRIPWLRLAGTARPRGHVRRSRGARAGRCPLPVQSGLVQVDAALAALALTAPRRPPSTPDCSPGPVVMASRCMTSRAGPRPTTFPSRLGRMPKAAGTCQERSGTSPTAKAWIRCW